MGLTHPHSPTPPASAPPALRAARGAEVVAAIEAKGGNAEFVGADLKSPDEVRALAGRAADVDILVNNAGVFLFDDLSDREALERHLAVNLFGTYDVIRAFLPPLIAHRGGRPSLDCSGSTARLTAALAVTLGAAA